MFLCEKINGRKIRIFLFKCGKSFPLSKEVLGDLESQVTRCNYYDVLDFSLDLLVAAKWKGQHEAPLIRLSADDSLKQHIMAANYFI